MSAPATEEKSAETSATPRWGMVVDVNRCVGCQTCTIACKHANDTIPGVQWRRVIDVEWGAFPNVQREFLVTGCQHCAEPPCVPVCPTGATVQRPDGLVTMDYDTCIGCGYCAVACPYQARTIVHDKRWFYDQPTVQEEHVAHDERLGVAQKCTFCVDRIDDGLAAGLVPGVDPAATPACSIQCIAQAIIFGDTNDPESRVSKLTADADSFQLNDFVGTDPQIKYLYQTPAVPGRDADPADNDEESLGDPANPLVGKHQTLWDFRAAMNFTLGGMGSGLGVIAFVLHRMGYVTAESLTHIFLAAGLIMAVGLFFIFLEIGRKMRFLLALLRPQSSWMTREIYAVGLFYPAVAAAFLWPGSAPGPVAGVAALSALAFLYSQGRILQAGKGIPAWRVPAMPAMLVATGLFEGAGLYTLASLVQPELFPTTTVVPTVGATLAIVNGVLWYRYVKDAKKNGIGVLARRVLDSLTPKLHLLGHVVPLALWTTALLGFDPTGRAQGLAAAAAIAGGIWWKFTVITRAAFQQGFFLPKMPQRGSGSRAAPSRIPGI